MKIVEFRIQNFRSIEDTAIVSLSNDGITTLVGQNESGKSSILKGLYALAIRQIDNDDIRSGEQFPIITYVIQFDDQNEFEKIIDSSKPLTEEFKTTLLGTYNNNDMITLIFSWNNKDKNFDIDLEESCSLGTYLLAYKPEDGKAEEFNQWHIRFLEAFYEDFPDIILFENDILPNKIYLDQLIKKESNTNGYQAVLNFLKASNTQLETLEKIKNNDRQIEELKDRINKMLNSELDQFWSQYLGEKEKIRLHFDLRAEPNTNRYYLSFWAKDLSGTFTLAQRSSGAKWFISFFLAFLAVKNSNTKLSTSNTVLLIDEPGIYLHPTAQKDILGLLEQNKTNMQIIYSTHSPFLIDTNHLNRLLVVERVSLAESLGTQTKLLTLQQLSSCSTDALLPLHSKLGMEITQTPFITGKKSIILEELSALYYIQGFNKLFDMQLEMNILPATGADNLPLLTNLAIGLGLDFVVIFDNDKKGQDIQKRLMRDQLLKESQMILVDGAGIEDLFEPIDFKKISKCQINFSKDEKPSSYCKRCKLSKPIIAKDFKVQIENNQLSKKDLNKESLKKIERLMKRISNFISPV